MVAVPIRGRLGRESERLDRRKGEFAVELFSILRREFIYVWYYFQIQLRQIAPYWALGMVVGSFVSVFAKVAIRDCFERLKGKNGGMGRETLYFVPGVRDGVFVCHGDGGKFRHLPSMI